MEDIMDMLRKRDLIRALRNRVEELEQPLLTDNLDQVKEIEHLMEYSLRELSDLIDRMEGK